jgi:phage FluMu gp28-like protein
MTSALAQPAVKNPAALGMEWRPYQLQAIDDPKHIRCKFWCRQSGKDYTTAFQQVFRGLSDPRKADRDIFSVTQRQADLSFEKCALHARAMSEAMCPESHEDFEANIGGRGFTFTRRVLTLPNGVRIKSLPGRDPDAVVGDTCHIVFTEFALFPGGGFKHWQKLSPMALNNGLEIDAITTPRTKDTKAFELRQNARGRYSVSTVDIYRAVADGLPLYDEDGQPCTIEDLKEMYSDPVGWQTEYLCQECDDLDALINWGDIEAAYEKYQPAEIECADNKGYDVRTENQWKSKLSGLKGRVTAGWDVARKHHLSVLWVNEEVSGRHWLRLLLVMRRCSFPFQRAIIEQGMDAIPGMIGCGDSTGLGMESNEALELKYALRWRGVNFAGSRKLGLASRLQTTYQARSQALPAGIEWIHHDLHGLQRQLVGDRTIIHEVANTLEPDSHCDAAMANALALEAASLEVIGMESWTA